MSLPPFLLRNNNKRKDNSHQLITATTQDSFTPSTLTNNSHYNPIIQNASQEVYHHRLQTLASHLQRCENLYSFLILHATPFSIHSANLFFYSDMIKDAIINVSLLNSAASARFSFSFPPALLLFLLSLPLFGVPAFPQTCAPRRAIHGHKTVHNSLFHFAQCNGIVNYEDDKTIQ